MSVRDFDRDYAEEIIRRLKALPPDRKPKWGRMAATDLVPHLTQSMLYSMGRAGSRPFVGIWVTRRVAGPLILRGWVPLLKNVQLTGDPGLFQREKKLDAVLRAEFVVGGMCEKNGAGLFLGADDWLLPFPVGAREVRRINQHPKVRPASRFVAHGGGVDRALRGPVQRGRVQGGPDA